MTFFAQHSKNKETSQILSVTSQVLKLFNRKDGLISFFSLIFRVFTVNEVHSKGVFMIVSSSADLFKFCRGEETMFWHFFFFNYHT